MCGITALALASALLTVAPAVRADRVECPADTGNAKEMENKGRALFEEALRREASDPRTALEILSCVQRFADKPAVSLRLGIIAERLGNKKLAVTAFERYLALAGDAAPDRKEMQEHIDQLRRQVGVKEPPPPRPEPKPEPAPRPADEVARSATPGWILTGAGAAVMAVGGVLLLSAKKRNDDVHAIEPGTTYWNSARAKDELDTAKREQLLGTVGVVLGVATAAVGVWWVVDSSSGPAAQAQVGPDSARVNLRFRF